MSEKTAAEAIEKEIEKRVGDSDFVKDHFVVIAVTMPERKKK